MTFALVPRPVSLAENDGTFRLSPGAAIGADAGAHALAWLLHDVLARAGLRLPVVGAGDPSAVIRLRIAPDAPGVAANPEAYVLNIGTEGVDLHAASAAGLARGIQTVRQVLPADALRAAPDGSGPVDLPYCRIEDAPRFGWRGVHLDVARHFLPKDAALQMIDAAALHRLNVVHLHLTDDQGWRLEVPSRPRLTEVGAWRAETVVGLGREPKEYDGTPHGGFYSVADLREIVAYAAQRHIELVPEIDLPGHVQAVLAAYPELGVAGAAAEVAAHFGIFDDVLSPTEEALAFARDVLDVVIDVFPGRHVHLGGDECPRIQWRNDPAAAERAAALGLGSVDELQSWFLRELAAHLADHDRVAVGWDEVLEDGGMPADTVVMAWRGVEHAHTALAAGHDVVMAPHSHTYLDKYQAQDADEPLAQPGHVSLADVAGFDPAPPDLPGPGRVLGVQAQLRSEFLPTPRAMQYMAFPRLCALAEVAWAAGPVDVDGLTGRLAAHLPRLDALGLEYRPLDGPHPWQRGGTGHRRGRQDIPGW